jgi:hypothetical protein
LTSIEAWPLAAAIRSSIWAYPILEVVHFSAFAALVGSLLTLELRVFGAQRAIALLPLGRLAARIALVAFAFAAASGVLMFTSRATELALHPAFLAKLGLIGIAGANATLFHLRRSLVQHDRFARFQAGLSLLLWFAVITAGRLIAYL